MPAPSAESLLQAAGRGDGAAFETLVGRFAGELFGFFRRRVGDRDAPDLLQETFLRLHQAAPRYQPRASARSYIYTIARNLALNHLRDRHDAASLDDPATGQRPADAPAPIERLEAFERAERVRRAVESLSDPLREVVILRHYQKLPFREAAAILEIPEGTAMRRMSDALEKLRGLLGDLAGGL